MSGKTYLSRLLAETASAQENSMYEPTAACRIQELDRKVRFDFFETTCGFEFVKRLYSRYETLKKSLIRALEDVWNWLARLVQRPRALLSL